MGVDIHCVTYVVHFGPSKTLSGHLQEAGRGGRDGSQSYSLTVFLPKHLIHCDKQVKTFVKSGLISCARVALMSHFDEEIKPVDPLHNCCNFCHQQCKCSGNDCCSIPAPVFDNLPEHEEVDTIQCRNVNMDDRVCVKEALTELQMSLSFQSNLSVFGGKSHELSNSCLDDIVNNVERICSISDVLIYCPTSNYRLAVVILEVLNEVFGDIDISDEVYCISAVCPLVEESYPLVEESYPTGCLMNESFYEDATISQYSSDELSE